jgi:hypothetical protein
VSIVLSDPGVNGMPNSSNANPPILTENAIYARCFQAKVILNGLKKTGGLPEEAYSFDVVYIVPC